MFDCRLIIDSPMPGDRNMAVDELLLLDAAENATATLRFYGWDEPTLSLGYFQAYYDRNAHAASVGCAAVRRQTGGGAILHDRELTYSICLPPGHPLSRNAESLYLAAHHAFIGAIAQHVPTIVPPLKLKLREQPHRTHQPEEPFLCFQRKARGDVVVETDDASACEWKILGSAQRRYRGAVLQHGSLLLERSPVATELPGLWDMIRLSVAIEPLMAAVKDLLAKPLAMSFHQASLPFGWESKIAMLTNSKYGSPKWTKRR
jgi:lipoyl(octanoyl) transferase